MPPRKKKPNNLQPSKFDIQHFFERTSQKHHHHLQPHTNPTPTTNTNTKTSNEEKPSDTVLSPQTHFKFSPGMSQDDTLDEITWKISPINECFQAVSKQMPEVIKALAASSKIRLSPIHKNEDNEETCLDMVTSPHKPISLVSLRFKRKNSARDDVSGRSPFRTPPSLSHCLDKVRHAKNIEHGEPCDLRENKKALLELLYQVEDAIGVGDATVSNNNTFKPLDQIANELPISVNHAVERPKSDNPKDVVDVSNSNYLVLEVSEHMSADSVSAQRSYKVLRLLNEQFGEERAVNLQDEWSYSVIAPGDTLHIIGQFDEWGNCDIDHDNNFLTVHPDILVSGIRV